MGSKFSTCCGSSGDSDLMRGGLPESSTWRLFNYKELHAATNGFSEDNKLGEGGFGSVYWGKTNSGHQIAVKRLKTINSKAEMEFAVEVEILGRVRHKNLLGLRGYCVGGSQRLIVYDYMPNLSLLTHLHGRFTPDRTLDWKKRMKIIFGSAKGLVYLHHEVTPHIIHRDIKASNVLLDSEFEPLVADFGFAKLIPEGVSHMTTRVKGTLGYLAPEYAMWGKVSESCDVYSFGILLLEIVTGRKPIERLSGGVKRTITEWVDPIIAADQLPALVDPNLRGNFDDLQLRRILHAAARSVQSEPERRPTMTKVLSILQGAAAAADPLKNNTLALGYYGYGNYAHGSQEGADRSSNNNNIIINNNNSSSNGDISSPVGIIRIQSVKYQEELMAMDDEDCRDSVDDSELSRSGSDGTSVYGVFGAIEVQRVSHGYGQQTLHRRTALRG